MTVSSSDSAPLAIACNEQETIRDEKRGGEGEGLRKRRRKRNKEEESAERRTRWGREDGDEKPVRENQKKKERGRYGKLPNLVDIEVEPQLLDGVDAHVLGTLHVKLRGSHHPTTHSTTPGELTFETSFL